jgi:hypothetical protein
VSKDTPDREEQRRDLKKRIDNLKASATEVGEESLAGQQFLLRAEALLRELMELDRPPPGP